MLKQEVRLDRQLNDFDKALVTATYFGFSPITAPKVTKRDIEISEACGNHPHYDALDKTAFMRTYLDGNYSSLPHPLAVIYKKPVSRRKFGTYALHFVGSQSGIAEATLIRAALSILAEEGMKSLRLDINCIGDKESISTYERELTNHVRKFGSELPEHLKQRVKENVFDIFALEEAEALRLREMAPSSITYLSSQSRIYFKEVLEYIEALGIEFRLSPELVGEKNHSSHTIFTINNSLAGDILAVGYRYSRLSKLFGLRKEIPMTGVTIFSSTDAHSNKTYKELPRPKFYLIQLGREAKIKSLSLLETLRLHRIPVHHFIGKDKITTQLSNAESLKVSHLIIIGQKEALDNTATVRNISTRAQDTINLADLPQYLKNIRL